MLRNPPGRVCPVSVFFLKKTLSVLILCCQGLLLFPAPSEKAMAGSPKADIFTPRKGAVSQGILIVRTSDQAELFSQNPAVLYSPASVSKLVTAAAALHYFGPEHRFQTRLFHTGSRNKGRISGDLIIEGDGDPSFISEMLWKLATDLRHSGITEITGQLLIDNSLFGGSIRDELRLEGIKASSHAYDAPVTAFGINFNTLTLAIAPAEKAGQLARVQTDPYQFRGVPIDNQVRTVHPPARTNLRVTRVSLPNGHSRIVASGTISTEDSLQKIYRSVNDPVMSSGEIIRAFLLQQGITVDGKVSEISGVPEKARLLLAINGKSLGRIIRDMNLYSNNYISDVLVKRIGAHVTRNQKTTNAEQVVGTYSNGMTAIQSFLKDQVNISGPFEMVNGSGLTTNNRLSARQMTQLLSYLARRWDIFPEFIASLPLAGNSGSLESRFSSAQTSALAGKIRAKTGTLSEPYLVSSLAGYFHHERHGLLAFCIIQNSPKGKNKPGIPDLQESQELGLLKISRLLDQLSKNDDRLISADQG